MFKITGLDKFQRQLDEAQRGLSALNGNITTVDIDPNDPASLRRAIQKMESAVDAKVSAYSGNPFVAKAAKMAKENFRKRLLQRARTQA